MNKRLLLFIFISMLFPSMVVTTVFAMGSIKLVINEQEVKPLVSLIIVNNRVMAPAKQITEILGENIEWDDINETVNISNKKQLDIEKRLNLLEFALISQSPEEVAKSWANGVMTRNGALQYALLSDDFQSKYKADFEAWDWLTGASSPWIDSYQISKGEQQFDGIWKFTVKFHFTDSTDTTSSETSNILIGTKKVDKPPLPLHGTEQQWCIIWMEHDHSYYGL